jgi:hypothetical protein
MHQNINNQVPVDIQIILCKNKQPPRTISCQPITELRHETEESPQVSPSLCGAPVKGKGVTNRSLPEMAMRKFTLPSPFSYLPLALHRFSLVTFPHFLF